MVSVCMATFNGSQFIYQQLNTIIHQLKPNDEIIVSDDGSSDNTIEIIESFNDNRIKIFKGPCKRNPILNFENALKNAKGDLIFLSDQDDMWDIDKVHRCTQLLKKFDLVISDATIIDHSGNLIKSSFFEQIDSGKGIFKNIIRNTYIGACMCFRSDLLKFILPFPKTIPMHDSWIGLSGEIIGNVYFLEEKLVQYRRHANNKTTAPFEKSKHSLYSKIRFRFQMLSMVAISFKRKYKL